MASMWARRLFLLSLVAICLVPGDIDAQTLSPKQVLGRYQQYVWQDQHGLPQNTVRAIVRTRDGYLWFGTLEGAARFDGVRFTVFDSSNTDEIRIGLIVALLEDHAGNLWLGTDGGGLVRRTDGRFTRYGIEEGLADDHVMSLLEDRAGNLWIGTDGGGASLFRDGRFTTYALGNGLPDNQVWAISEDPDGGVWFGTTRGLARYHHGRFKVYTVEDGLVADAVRALWWDKAGTLWVGTDGGLSWYRDGRFTVPDATDGPANARVSAIFQDREGSIWVGAGGRGVYRFADGRFSLYATRDGLPSDQVETIYQGAEGDLWIGTNGQGVSQLRAARFRVFSTQDGLANDSIRAIYEDSTGRLWIGTDEGLSQFTNGAFTTYSKSDGLTATIVRSIGEDTTGNLWFGTREGLSRFRAGRFETWTTGQGLSSNNVYTVLGDRAGNVWAGTMGAGLNRLRDGRIKVFTTQDGLADANVLALYQDREDNLWIGTRSGGMSRFQDGRFTSWSTKDGLASNHVLSFYEDRAGSLWVGTHGGGLVRFKGGTFKTITTRDGLYDNLAFQILDDDLGNLWMIANKGIYRANLQELNDFADGKKASVTSFSYGVADGMRGREGNGANPAGWKSRDGRLWFPTATGAVVIDPTPRNSEPPLVAIESVVLDREAVPVGQAVRVGPDQENLEIQYTGLSWSRPQQIKFKYQLHGLDHDWIDAGTRRTAYYSHVPPGDYRFQVIADNGEGVWNTTGSSVHVAVLPAFYQTRWFLVMAAAAGAGLVGLAWQSRVRQWHRAQGTQQAFSRRLIASQENERQRIAGELHDSLGQHLLIIKNRALLGSISADDRTAARLQFDEIAASAGQSLEEVRQIAYNLRPYHLDRLGLTQALEAMVDSVAASSTMHLEAELASIDGLFSKEAEIGIFRVVQESLNNIVKHSRASTGTITTDHKAGMVTIAIADNGRGFDPQVVGASGHGGFGLAGIAERVRILGGVCRIHSVSGEGTTVTITLHPTAQVWADATP
jgi:ligand-binding sensor domain-containing protein/signal transduction histidine kinase